MATAKPGPVTVAPFGNVALLGANELMFHQVGPVGDAQWEITDGASAAIPRFCDDLTEPGIDFTPPQDPFNDPAWSSLLTQTYLVSAFA
jgi:hypothetical protein